jgi:predicted nucleic acid-binding protein
VKWLIDTSVVSETAAPRPNLRVLRWFGDQPAQEIAISIVSVAELQHGVLLTQDHAKRTELARWIDEDVFAVFVDRILTIDSEILVQWLDLQRLLLARRQTRSSADLLLAATAVVRSLTMVTRNTRDFANTGITVYNPWTDETHTMEAP